MSLNPKLSVASRNLSLNAALDVCNSGFLDIYDGAQPADADTAVSTQTKLAHLPLSATAFAAASSGSKTANAITSAAALATGTAAWCRLTKSDGTAVSDGSVGTASANAIIATTTIVAGATISCSSCVFSQAA